MRIAIKIFALFVLFLLHAKADNIHLRNGLTIKNCILLDTVGTRIRVKTSEGQRQIPITTVEGIVRTAFDSSKATYIINMDGSTRTLKATEQDITSIIQTNNNQTYISEIEYTYPNAVLFPISAIAFGLAWDYFAQASDIQEAINDNNKRALQAKITIDNSKFESQKNRKTVLGITFLVAGVVNTIIASKTVELTAANKTIGISFNF